MHVANVKMLVISECQSVLPLVVPMQLVLLTVEFQAMHPVR